MAFCRNCAAQMDEGLKTCSACGTAAEQPRAAGSAVESLLDTPDSTASFDADDIAQNKFMAILSYVWILVIIPWFVAPGSKFARFHAKQGVTLAALYIAYMIVSFLLGQIKTTQYLWGLPYQATPGIVVVINWLLGLPLFILSIIGVINAAQGKAKELPVVGKFKIVK